MTGNGMSNKEILLYLMKKVDAIDDKIDKKVDKKTFQWVLGIVFAVICVILKIMWR